MPWCQTLDSILPAVANSLRLLFVDDVRKSNELIEGANSTTGKTLKAVLDIWAVDLRYLFSYLPADTDIAGIILSLSALLDSPAMRSRAAIVLLSIYRSTSCDVLDSRRKIKMESLSEVYFAIARFTLDAGKEQRIIQLALNLLIVSAEVSIIPLFSHLYLRQTLRHHRHNYHGVVGLRSRLVFSCSSLRRILRFAIWPCLGSFESIPD